MNCFTHRKLELLDTIHRNTTSINLGTRDYLQHISKYQYFKSAII